MPDILVFLGHDFFGSDRQRKEEYRRIVSEACEAANRDPQILSQGLRFIVVYGDTNHQEYPALYERIRRRRKYRLGGRYWNEIRAIIEASDYALFDLTYHRVPNPEFFNANVLLEYGVAIGYRKKTVPFGRDLRLFLTQLSNTAGYTFYTYDALDELRNLITFLLTRYPYVAAD
jgi:hypothetical protein